MRRAALAAALGVVLLSACAASLGGFTLGAPERRSALQGYFFDYQLYGGEAVGLLQVFDDGERTYFQFRDLDLKRVPAISAEDSSGARRPVRIEATSPYLVVPEVARKFVLVFVSGKDAKESSVVRIGAAPSARVDRRSEPASASGATPERPDRRAKAPSAPGAQPPQSKLGAEARPATSPAAPSGRREAEVQAKDTAAERRGEQPCVPWASSVGRTINVPFGLASTEPTRKAQEDLKEAAKRLASAGGSILVVGRPSPGGGAGEAQKRAQALRTALVRAGVPASRISAIAENVPKGAPSPSVYYSEVIYGMPSSGFVLADGC